MRESAAWSRYGACGAIARNSLLGCFESRGLGTTPTAAGWHHQGAQSQCSVNLAPLNSKTWHFLWQHRLKKLDIYANDVPVFEVVSSDRISEFWYFVILVHYYSESCDNTELKTHTDKVNLLHRSKANLSHHLSCVFLLLPSLTAEDSFSATAWWTHKWVSRYVIFKLPDC